jgi:hypothetical protein
MIDLKTFSVVAAASAALLGFSTGHVSADTAKAPVQMAQAGGSGSSGGTSGNTSGSRSGGSMNNTPSGSGSSGSGGGMPSSGSSSGSTSMGADQCGQISDPRARQDCVQRQNDMRSGSGATGNRSTGSGSGTTNRGTGSK